MSDSMVTGGALKVLILGGTTESRLLAEQLATRKRFAVVVSFAGRTTTPSISAVPYRIGGFGGASGLAEFLERERFAALVDATHPFAAQISTNAVHAARLSGVPLVRLERDDWQRQPGDRWQEVDNMSEAARAIGAVPRRVFLSIGRQELGAFAEAPQHDYLIRSIEPSSVNLARARVILQRGPFQLEDELRLLETEAIEVIVSKHSGTAATYAKIEAARRLALPVILVKRPELPAATVARDIAEVVRWLDALNTQANARRCE
ncbi:MAG TPA: cobalt-precorrin-6A reductase [Polyangiaceae bacterium]|nr:cobalt-precorrin-6A reductase [Polyangiaceae bacterium]